jgi:hypothetical protein
MADFYYSINFCHYLLLYMNIKSQSISCHAIFMHGTAGATTDGARIDAVAYVVLYVCNYNLLIY